MEEGNRTPDPPATAESSEGAMQGGRATQRRKPLISPTSSFVDFAELDTEIYNEADKVNAYLYDPFKDRVIKKPMTDFETCVHLLKGSIGAGVLAMPGGFRDAGYLIGIPGTACLGFLCIYGIHIMLSIQRLQCQRLRVPFLTLPRSLKIAFLNGPQIFHKVAWLAPFLADFFLVANQIGLCATYINFVAESLKQVLESTLIKNDLNVRYYMASLFIPVLMINYIRNLKKMAPVSLVADILMAAGFGICFYYIFGVGQFDLEKNKVVMVASFERWPLFVGTVMFALEAVGVMIALEHNMKNPQKFLGKKGIFPWCMTVVMCLYMALGLSGYLKYGHNVKPSIQETLPPNQFLSNCVHIMISLAIYGSYPLQCFVGLEIIWGNYLIHYIKNHNKEYVFEYMLRTAIVILTFILAMAIPRVDMVISLVGALCLSNLGLVFPFLMELCTLWPDQLGYCKIIILKDVLLVLIGLSILVIGTTTSLNEIIENWVHEKSA